ncbi:MAG TPA: HAMP domain-containing sensor histidine kinase [Acidimicrobiales bacterium]|nr:HAMP domain-containing sensor histidine kinase [Acidimicrobiales bacterium]
MTRFQVIRWARRRIPHTVRARLSVLYAALFLAAGATLLGVTYGLVASSLPNPSSAKLNAVQEGKLQAACKLEGSSSALAASNGKNPQPRPSPSCRAAFAAGSKAATTSQRDQTLHNLLLFSLLGLGAMTLASGGLGWVMAGRVLRPVRTITGAARRASEQHLGERLALQGPKDELKELADTFDEMLDRLDAGFASRRRFVADASHELRTPLTVMRTAIDVTLAKPTRSPGQLEAMASKVRRSVDKAESLIGALLTLAMSEREVTSNEFVDLATVAEDVLDAAQAAVDRLDLRVEAELEPAETTGDRLLLERLIGNLVDNAMQHNHPGGWVRVRTGTMGTTCATGDSRYVSVANSGPVVPGDQVDALFEPFRRVEERTSAGDGVGLGLAIVKSIAAAHDATVEARSQSEGGLLISVVFPGRLQTNAVHRDADPRGKDP